MKKHIEKLGESFLNDKLRLSDVPSNFTLKNKVNELIEAWNNHQCSPVEEWKPKFGQPYWTIHSTGVITNPRFTGKKKDLSRLQKGFYFKTESEAKAASDYLKECLRKFKNGDV